MCFSSVSKGSEAYMILPCRQEGAGSVCAVFTCISVSSCLLAFECVASFKKLIEE